MAKFLRRSTFFVAASAMLIATAAFAQTEGEALVAPQTAIPFSVIMTIIGMVLGLGFTRMLSSLIGVYRSRRRAVLDWVPLSWALCIFLTDLQFWWSINAASRALPIWTFEEFVALVIFTMLLFVSGALLLPPTEMQKNESLRAFFEEEGRWSLAFLTVYFVLTLIVNVALFKTGIMRPWAAVELGMAGFVFAAYRARSQSVQRTLAAVAVPVFMIYCASLSDDWLFRYLE